MSHIPVLRAELVPDDPTTVVFTDSDTEVTVTIPASALVYQRSIDMEGEHLTHMCTPSMHIQQSYIDSYRINTYID